MSAALEYDYRLTFVDPRHAALAPRCEVVSLAHIGGRGTLATPCPWPLKLGTPTKSLMELHNNRCGLKHPAKDMDIFGCCACPRARAWLRAELRKADKR